MKNRPANETPLIRAHGGSAVPSPDMQPSVLLRPSPLRPALRLVRSESDVAAAPARRRDHEADVRRAQVATENKKAAKFTASEAAVALARQAQQSLDGGAAAILTPDRRRALVAAAVKMGLRPFDANLIIAIVQDSARCAARPMESSQSDAPAYGHDTGGMFDDRLMLIPHPRLIERRREQFWASVRLVLAALSIAGIIAAWLVHWLSDVGV